MAGRSAAIAQVRALVGKVARSMAPVLIAGESGTGKELVARAIHAASERAAAAFVAVNCSAIPEQLLEAEFFGYRKGAFTGAAADREGFFQAASGGTLFLDEIGDLPLAMQAKLLRAIQERSVRPVGAVAEQPVSVRLLSATHKDLAAEVHAGRFRQDLYYRLNVIPIVVPPLRERLGDLPDIAAHVLARLARDAGVEPPPQLTPHALDLLRRQPFPGNVRELENLLHRAVALSGADRIDADRPRARRWRRAGRRRRVGVAGGRRDETQRPPLDAECAGRALRSACRPAAAGRRAAAAAGPRRLPRRGRTRHPAACPRPPPQQPHRRRREPRAVAAADALPHGAAGHRRRQRRRVRQRERRLMAERPKAGIAAATAAAAPETDAQVGAQSSPDAGQAAGMAASAAVSAHPGPTAHADVDAAPGANLGAADTDTDTDTARDGDGVDGWLAGGWLADARRRPSPNFGPRPPQARVTLALVHSISLPPGVYGGDAIERLFMNRLDWDEHPYFQSIRGLEVSSHFLIRRDGGLMQFVGCDERAWHAGRSCWRGREGCNDFAVGIELEGLEGGAFEDAQYRRLAALLGRLKARYPLEGVAGHEHVAPGRKHDPGPGFDWPRLQRETRWPQRYFP